jgi:hypothetical protein
MLQRYKQASECEQKQEEASFSLFCGFMCGLGSIHPSSVCVGSNEKISNFSGERNFVDFGALLSLPHYLTKFQRRNSERRPVPMEVPQPILG